MTNSELTSFVTESDLEMLNRPVGEARGLPGAAYGARFYQLEQQRLFPRQWCVAGFECDIPQPGDVRPVELACESACKNDPLSGVIGVEK